MTELWRLSKLSQFSAVNNASPTEEYTYGGGSRLCCLLDGLISRTLATPKCLRNRHCTQTLCFEFLYAFHIQRWARPVTSLI